MFQNTTRHSSDDAAPSIPISVKAPHTQTQRAIAIAALATVALAATCGAALGASSPAKNERAFARASTKSDSAGAWGWSSSARAWASRTRVLSPAVVKKGPAAPITRNQFVAALAKIEQLRAASTHKPGQLTNPELAAPARAGARAGSLAARALALRWLTPIKGAFAGFAPISSNEAALGMAGVLGLRGDVQTFAVKLRTEVPGTKGSATYQSAQALIRSVGLRYNVRDPYDAVELGPTEALNVGHGSYMFQVAATGTQSWKLDDAHRLATTFDLPDLGPNQRAVLATAVAQLGQPYVWAGETEGKQAEGHGGFDCSGFAMRVTNGSGLAPEAVASLTQRTTYTQSALPAPSRIARLGLLPADVIFFGDHGPKSTPSQNYHAGVYMGNGWFIHSSGGNGGVAINQLDGSWWTTQFAWGRRTLLAP
jgi:cell wall-associated NlpC family hydrolase